jgi:hypothetical protein
MVQMVTCNLAVLSIAALYYAWRDGYLAAHRAAAKAQLRDRVAYMLWVAAQRSA